jgi:hypothetical protein
VVAVSFVQKRVPGQLGASFFGPGQLGASFFGPGQLGASLFGPGQLGASMLGPGQLGAWVSLLLWGCLSLFSATIADTKLQCASRAPN